jgi:hypothetical protein
MDAKCPVCGYRFDTDSAPKLCSNCPMNSGCDKICCPNCHYSWPASSKIVGGLLSMFKKGKKSGRP